MNLLNSRTCGLFVINHPVILSHHPVTVTCLYIIIVIVVGSLRTNHGFESLGNFPLGIDTEIR